MSGNVPAYIRAVSSESSRGAFWTAEDTKVDHADKEDSDQTAAESQADLRHRWALISEGTYNVV